MQEIPGTFGDPFRVMQTLPGVASVVSLLPFPVVRGASPSLDRRSCSTARRCRCSITCSSGPSVIHPDFIDEIQFYPGGAPAPYGGYTAGIIDGRTARADPESTWLDFDLNLLSRGPRARADAALGATFTAAARYGYPGFLLGLATNQISLSYWDYQLRLDGGRRRNGWTRVRVRRATTSSTPSRRPPRRTPRTRRSRRR